MKFFSFVFVSLLLFSCVPEKQSADLLVKNARVYTVNEAFDLADAFVVRDGKILEIGIKPELELKYAIAETYDAQGMSIVPGLIDAHAHLYNLGVTKQQVDLTGTQSLEEVLDRVVAFQKEKKTDFILGRGWDQNDWEEQNYPTKTILDSLFPNTPVALTRVDGHALWVNSIVLEQAGITSETIVDGGEVVMENGEPSGILIDSPMALVRNIIPRSDTVYNINALKDAEANCIALGLTTVNDAGLDRSIIELIDSLQQSGAMKLRVYAMVSNTPENLDHYLAQGPYITERLTVRSVKVYGDGALGSRGAALRAPYSDLSGHYGAMITREDSLQVLADRIEAAGFQMNTHAIGDSANVSVLRVYKNALANQQDARWKVEHAQVISPENFEDFSGNIIPSVQPTHATSDMYWAEDRLGTERMSGAYAYKTLLEAAGKLVLGTDFPVEQVNPMYTFYAAVARKDLEQYPEDGFQMQDALTREQTLRGMTQWAAYSNFEENQKGTIETGKVADFVVLDRDIMEIPVDSIPKIKVLATFINGEKVYEVEAEGSLQE
ncbi:amidohydrolase [Altibacter sp. HG106]|uniref:amidohydrolase n=1 Tax=Altibacter sp. HG106 TaxID=3023937 RepID=UPI00234FEF03|nr:amidohydrolase family protein [Altibacter sp. HG106]MDC7996120.1 amidohydrolase family protein [Altibacter sp. HG106]